MRAYGWIYCDCCRDPAIRRTTHRQNRKRARREGKREVQRQREER